MKKLKDISTKIKLPAFIGMASFLILFVVNVILMIPIRNSTLKTSVEITRLSAASSGQIIMEEINSVGGTARALAGVVEEIALSRDIPAEQKREYVISNLSAALKKGNRLTNLWCVLEPNGLDGLDSLYIGKPMSNSDGVFIAWFIDHEWRTPLDPHSADFYIHTKQVKHETLSDPYFDEIEGEKVHMFSFCVPIIAHGKFIGEVGIDFKVEDLIEILDSDFIEDARGQLVSSSGLIVVSRDADLIGTSLGKGDPDILAKLRSGQMFDGYYKTGNEEVYNVFIPVQLGEGIAPWYYVVDIPIAAIYANSNTLMVYMIIFNLLAIVLIIFIVWLIVRKVTGRIIGVTDIIHQMSFGRINISIDRDQGKDELGQMNSELGLVIDALQQKSTFAKNIGEGAFDSAFTPLSKEDELGNSLLEMRSNLSKAEEERKQNQTEEEKRNWSATGIARFAEILRQDNNDLEAFSYNIISNLVKYMNANQGGIFILNEDDPNDRFLELHACYAYNRKKYIEKKIYPGDGLVGTCFLEGERIYMTDLPRDYITITSGLGDDTPRALLISPLKVNGEIYGVLEIASFKPFEAYQLQFIERLSESVASTISSVKINIRTNMLLQQSKLQTEELANQEEELRQNMEEMQTTQEDMRHREEELNIFLNAVREGTYVIEIDAHLTITSINDQLLDFLKVKREDVVGASFNDFIRSTHDMNGQSYAGMWKDIFNGKQANSVDKVTLGDGTTNVLKQHYAPIPGKDGRIEKVMILAITGVNEQLRIALEEMAGQEEKMKQKNQESEQARNELSATLEQMQKVQYSLENEKMEVQYMMGAIDSYFMRITYDTDMRLIDINDRWLQFNGKSKEEMLGMVLLDNLSPDAVPAFKEKWKKILAGETMMDEGLRKSKKGFAEVWLTYCPIKNVEGKVYKVLALGRESEN